MKFSVTATFTALFLVVSGFYIYLKPVDKPGEGELPVSQEPQRVLKLEENDQLNWIQIQNRDRNETITLIRKDDVWEFKFPVSYAADANMVQGLVMALKLSTQSRRLVPKSNWDEYGLQNPELKVGVEANSGERRYLYFGDKSPVGDTIFARWEGEESYFLVKKELKKSFERTVYSLRQKQVFSILSTEISKIRIRTPEQDYEIIRRKGQWFWLEPIPILGEPLEKAQLDEVLNRVTRLNIKEFLDEEKRDEIDLGFSFASSFIKVWGKKKRAETLNIGKAVPTRDSFYGKKENKDAYFFVARGPIRNLFQTMETIAQGPLADLESKDKDDPLLGTTLKGIALGDEPDSSETENQNPFIFETIS